MDLASFGIASVASISIICYLIGLVVKTSGLDNKWIPIICGVCGMILGILGIVVIPDFPANDYITAAAVGVVSGLAATGADQVLKQLKNNNS